MRGAGASESAESGALPAVTLTLEEVERLHVKRVLEHCEGNRSQAARVLGVSRVGLYKKLQRMAIDL